MKHIIFIFVAAYAALMSRALATDQVQTYQSGMADLAIKSQDGKRDLTGFLWFPTDATSPLTNDFDSAVWQSTRVVKDAKPARGRFPLVLLSHGMFGNAYNQAWLAGALAEKGFVVAAISHPGTSTWLRDPDQRRELWERPKDISRTIDHAVSNPTLSAIIDPERIFMAGHSLGGFTAIALAGGRYDAAKLKRFCDGVPEEMVCDILAGWKIAQTAQDRTKMEADLSDSRIKAFAVLDLGGTQSFATESLHQLNRPMLVFGAPITNSGLTLDIESRALVKALPAETTSYIEPNSLTHFDFLGQCKPEGFSILAKEEPGDEVICANGGAKRAEKHAMIIESVTAFFSTAALEK